MNRSFWLTFFYIIFKYIKLTCTTKSNELNDIEVNLRINNIRPSSIQLLWDPPVTGFYDTPNGFSIEISKESINDDFQSIQILSSNTFEYKVTNLIPLSYYGFRLKILQNSNSARYTSIINCTTLDNYQNKWNFIINRRMNEETVDGGFVYPSVPNANRPGLPTSRRGHSMVLIQGFIYVFGGYQDGYDCDKTLMTTFCLDKGGVNSELWRYDPLLHIWQQLFTIGNIQPPSRQYHSAVVISSRLLIFGGRNGDKNDKNAAFNDLWELYIEEPRYVHLENPEKNINISEGKQIYTKAMVDSLITNDWCIKDMTVDVIINHPCLQDLEIRLYGPGPTTFPHLQQDVFAGVSTSPEQTWQDVGVLNGYKRKVPLNPSSNAYSVDLLRLTGYTKQCLSGLRTINFNENAKMNISSKSNLFSGYIRPLETLQVFNHLPASTGPWTLMIYDKRVDTKIGTLSSWDIRFKLEKCIPTYQWRDISNLIDVTTSIPSPRFHHTAITFGKSMFIYGGRDTTYYNDLYRFDYDPVTISNSKWFKLKPYKLQSYKSIFNSNILLTPYQIIALPSRLRQNTMQIPYDKKLTKIWRGIISNQNPLYVQNPSSSNQTWEYVFTKGHSVLPSLGENNFIQENDKDNVDFPDIRSYSSALYLDPNDPVLAEYGLSIPKIILYGGSSMTNNLGDMWSLDLQRMNDENPYDIVENDRKLACESYMVDPVVNSIWDDTCGGNAPTGTCDLRKVMFRAWCNKEYQSIYNL